MRTFTLVAGLLFSCGVMHSQCPVGDIILTSQAQVNAFATNWPACDTILGNLTIGDVSAPSDITDLSPLNQVAYVSYSVNIIGNSMLTNLSGLDNLQAIGGTLTIQENSVLNNLDGLTQLDTIKNLLDIAVNPLLSSIQGLSDLDYLHEFRLFLNPGISSLTGLEQAFIDSLIYITNNESLTSLEGLGSLQGFRGTLLIVNNRRIEEFSILSDLDSLYSLQLRFCDSLTNLQVLENLVFVEDWFRIDDNSRLSTLEGLVNLKQVGGLGITDNVLLDDLSSLPPLKEIKGNVHIGGNGLQSLEGLDSLATIGGDLLLLYENNLADLHGLENLTTIGNDFWLLRNGALNNLSGLEQLRSIGAELDIQDNDGLLSLQGLEQLRSIGQNFFIEENDVLVDLNGLQGLDSIGGTLLIYKNSALSSLDGLEQLQYIGSELFISRNVTLASLEALNHSILPLDHVIYIFNNSNLSECAVQVVCETLQADSAYVNISGNATGCQNNQEVLEACLTPVSPELDVLPACVLFPNPVHHALHVFVKVPYEEVTIGIRDISGRVWMQDTFFRNQQVDLSFLDAGIYFVEIEVNGYRTTRKIVKI